MRQDQATKAILSRWITMWPGLSSNVPYVFDNDVGDEALTYARLSIDYLDEEQQTLGDPGHRKYLEPGIINVKLYTPGNAGSNAGEQLAELVRQIYQSVRFGAAIAEDGITTFATSVDVIRPTVTTQFWTTLARTGFQFFDVR